MERVAFAWLTGVWTYWLVSTLALQFFIYCAVVAAAHSVVYYERSRERDQLAARLATDDGPGPATPAASGRQQVGLGNTRARLEALYGSHQRLELAHAAPRGARVSLEIPFRATQVAP